MPTIAIVVATSRTGTEIISQTLLPSIPPPEPVVVNAIVRSRERFRKLHPQAVLQNPNLHLFDYHDKDPSSLAPALKDVDTIYITTGGTEFDKPVSHIHDAIENVIACLISLRLSSESPWKKPKIILLSSGGLNPRFQRESAFARLMKNYFMKGVNTHFFDLEISEQLLVSFAQTGCYDYVLLQPGMIVTAEPTGDWELRDCAYSEFISYADMAASMIHLASTTEWDGKIAAPTTRTPPKPGFKGQKSQVESMGWMLRKFVVMPLLKVAVFGGIGFGIGWWARERALKG